MLGTFRRLPVNRTLLTSFHAVLPFPSFAPPWSRRQDVKGVISQPKLENLLNSFDPFETKMQEGTQARLLKDKLKVEAMAKETDRLTNTLSQQVQIRRQMNEQLQRFCETKLDTCYTFMYGR